MATIACPGCGKQFKLPADAAGRTASCSCGKRFKIGGVAPASAAAQKPQPVAAAVRVSAAKAPPTQRNPTAAVTAKSPAAPKAAAPSPSLDDDFWNEGLREPVPKPAPIAASPIAPIARPATPPPAKKKRKQKSSFSWGADWGKALGGLATFLICGSLAAAEIYYADRIHFILPILAIGGLGTALSGLMGD